MLDGGFLSCVPGSERLGVDIAFSGDELGGVLSDGLGVDVALGVVLDGGLLKFYVLVYVKLRVLSVT